MSSPSANNSLIFSVQNPAWYKKGFKCLGKNKNSIIFQRCMHGYFVSKRICIFKADLRIINFHIHFLPFLLYKNCCEFHECQ